MKSKILLVVALIFFFFSCKKEKLEKGIYQLTANFLSYSYNEETFSIDDFTKDLELLEKSEFLLEFNYKGKMNYLTVDSENYVSGLWVFEDTVPGTNNLLGYNIEGKIKKEKRNWFIDGSINFKGRHEVGSSSHIVDVNGGFSLFKI